MRSPVRALLSCATAVSAVAVLGILAPTVAHAADDAPALDQCLPAEISAAGITPNRVVEHVTAGAVRVATMNAQLTADREGGLISRLSLGEDERAQQLAHTLQLKRPKVVVLTGFDYDEGHEALENFHTNFLGQSQQGADPIQYQYQFTAPVNSGIDSGADLNKDGQVGGPEDMFGPGDFPGQGGMVVLSQLPIVEDEIRTFTDFRWQDLPQNTLENKDFTDLERAAMPLQSKALWDIPIRSGRQVINVVANHLDAPAQYGQEPVDEDRHQDQLAFLKAYLRGGQEAEFITDDDGVAGGLTQDAQFVVAGQLNADPSERLRHRIFLGAFDEAFGATSEGASEKLGRSNQDATMVQANAEPGEFQGHRLNYVLASSTEATLEQQGVYWPTADQATVFPGPDDYGVSYRLVWADISF